MADWKHKEKGRGIFNVDCDPNILQKWMAAASGSEESKETD